MKLPGNLFGRSSEEVPLKDERWIVDSTPPYDGAEVINQIVQESWSCRDCAGPGVCEKHVQSYREALAIDVRNR